MSTNLKCYKVRVSATNAMRTHAKSAARHATGGSDYVDCLDGVLYVVGRSLRCVEEVVSVESVLCVEVLGPAYVVEVGP